MTVSIKSGSLNGGVLGDLNAAWTKYQGDERITGKDSADALANLAARAQYWYDRSKAVVTPSKGLVALDNKGALEITNGKGSAKPTFHAFSQICQRAKVDATMLRAQGGSGAVALAAANLNWGLQTQAPDDVQILLTSNGQPGEVMMRAVTGETYGRIWNKDVMRSILPNLTPEWKVPGIFGKAVGEITSENTSLYIGPEDMVFALTDEERRIEVPNRRDGRSGTLARGFIVRNSEVGRAVYSIKAFLFDYCCWNRNFWGVEEFVEVRIKHTSRGPERFFASAVPALRKFAEGSTTKIVHQLEAARNTRIEEPLEFLSRHFTGTQAKAMVGIHEVEEHRPIENMWDVNVAATAFARECIDQNTRLEIETKAGALMQKV
jgi:hypothetical protein